MAESTPPMHGPTVSAPAFRPDPYHRFRPNETVAHAQSLFREIPIFRDVPPHHLRQFARFARSQTFAPGEAIVRVGEFGSTMYVIKSGRVEVVLDGPSERMVAASLGPGEFFGELSIFDGEPRSASVIAVEETEVLVLGRVDVVRLLTGSPEMALSLLKSLSARLRIANARLGTTPTESTSAGSSAAEPPH